MHELDGIQVVTAQEMRRIEKDAFQKGYSELEFMQKAGASIANEVEKFIQEKQLPKEIILFAGKGNNAGDGFTAGTILHSKGYSVIAYPIYPIELLSPLCHKMYENFYSQGGKVEFSREKIQEKMLCAGLILDALVGTGMKGEADKNLVTAIELANQSLLPILAIDIPSGLNGTTGAVDPVAICATKTIYLELAKTGFFLQSGWDHVGEITRGTFGLEKSSKITASACLLNTSCLKLPIIQRTWHKYEKGYVIAVAGSEEMPGAAILASCAALRSGAGIVRLFSPFKITTPYEIIYQPLDSTDSLDQELMRARAVLVGPGLGRTRKTDEIVYHVLTSATVPLVIDADALFSLAEHVDWKLPSSCVLTPHKQEMKRLLGLDTKEEVDWLSLCQKYVEKKHITLVLKGAPTFVFSSGYLPIIITQGDPGLATAGSGDVLTGVIAALLSHRLDPRHAAALGCFIHAIAGKKAAADLTSYSVIASDLLHYLPQALSLLLK